MAKYLLVYPKFPFPKKSRYKYIPVGLLRIASYLKSKGHVVKYVEGNEHKEDFKPDEIWITSYFTYWAKYVKEAVQYYRRLYPKAKIVVGGVYASLMPRHCKEYTGCDEVYVGVFEEAENFDPDYSFIPDIDYQATWTTRGCLRKCPFCGVPKIIPRFVFKKSVKEEIKRIVRKYGLRKIVFYDDNFNLNPYVDKILDELIELKKEGIISKCELITGFDYRELTREQVRKLKKAGFIYPRISWDWSYDLWEDVEKVIKWFVEAGYRSNDIFVHMLYNWKIPFEEMELKRIKCWEWKVQISDCRFRPLNQTYDNYNPRVVGQTSRDYYIHPMWTDAEVKQFRRNVRRQNICVRHKLPYYSRVLEKKITTNGPVDRWDPGYITRPEDDILALQLLLKPTLLSAL